LKQEIEGKHIDPLKDYVLPEKRAEFRQQVDEKLKQIKCSKPDWARYNVY
jgi:hypothetical protein